MTSDAVIIAERFASALDRDDFEAARPLLAPDCEYRLGDSLRVGPEAILASYRESTDKAHSLFDEVVYDHEVGEESGGRVTVTFRDRLRRGERKHEFRCQQVLLVQGGLILGIEHRELPGERARLRAFLG